MSVSVLNTTTTPHLSAVALADLSPLERQRLFALRFRTEYCRTWLCTGECRYRDKCMFAHGEEELRTEAQNDADHLTSDKAVRMWIRDRRRAAYALAQAAKCEEEGAAATAEAKEVIAQPATPTESFLDSHEHASDDSSDEHDRSLTACIHALPPSPVEGKLDTATVDNRMPVSDDRVADVLATQSPSTTTAVPPVALGAVVFQYRYNPYSPVRVKLTLRLYAAPVLSI